MHNITFSTCWYIFKCKFNIETYLTWIDNFLTNVNNYNLVIYSDKESSVHLEKYLVNPLIKLIIKSYTDFYTYKYKDFWVCNHAKNHLLNNRIDWKVNMLWSEKISFVYETMNNGYFDTEFYGWCDIGYFRDSISKLKSWPNPDIIKNLYKDKIYYACVNNDDYYINNLVCKIKHKNELNLPIQPIDADQVSIAGGFFISHKNNLEWWKTDFYSCLDRYFINNYLVKDDQIIICDCVFSNIEKFLLCKENNSNFDNWFLFQRFLM